MGNSLVVVAFHAEEFSTPDYTVESVASSIPGDPKVRSIDVILCRTSGNVRLMMLDANNGQARPFGPLRRSVIRMQIAYDGLRLETIQAAEVVDRSLESLARFERFQITDVLAEENIF